MTNQMIIFLERCRLMDEGVIGTTGRSVEIETEDGEKKTIFEPEPLYTYNEWKKRGYQVQKNQIHVAEIYIWKYKKGRKNQTEEEEQEPEKAAKKRNSNMYWGKGYFFKASQVKPIKEA